MRREVEVAERWAADKALRGLAESGRWAALRIEGSTNDRRFCVDAEVGRRKKNSGRRRDARSEVMKKVRLSVLRTEGSRTGKRVNVKPHGLKRSQRRTYG